MPWFGVRLLGGGLLGGLGLIGRFLEPGLFSFGFPNEDAFIPVLGEEGVAKYFRQAFELKIKGDKLPSDKAGELVEKVQALFAEYGCTDALEAKECVVPVENFKALRFAEMDLAQSLALENVGDKGLTECSVSTKGTRSK